MIVCVGDDEAQQASRVQETSPPLENMGSKGAKEADLEPVDMVSHPRHNLRAVARRNYQELDIGADPLQEYEDSSYDVIHDPSATTKDTRSTSEMARSCLSHLEGVHPPIVEQGGLPREGHAPQSSRPPPAIHSYSVFDRNSPNEFTAQGFQPVNRHAYEDHLYNNYI